MVKNSSNHRWGGQWTQIKLVALAEYLKAYTTALKKQKFELIYIDGFSGAGYRKLTGDYMELFQETFDEEIKEGSPFIALKIDNPPFDRFVFIEKDKKTLDELETALGNNFPESKSKMEFLNKDANDYIRNGLEKRWVGKRAVMFLDPFSIQVDYESIKTIARTEAIDLWILFPLMAANRLLKKDGKIPPNWKSKLNSLFGDDEWKERMYKTKGQGSLLTSDNGSVEKDSYKTIVDYFVEKLKEDFGNKGVAEPKYLYANRGSPLFALCFASGNPRGQMIAVDIANHILKKQ